MISLPLDFASAWADVKSFAHGISPAAAKPLARAITTDMVAFGFIVFLRTPAGGAQLNCILTGEAVLAAT
jgi:hypothetical protein